MRRVYFPLIALLIAIAVTIGTCKAMGSSNENAPLELSHERSSENAFENGKETETVGTKGFDSLRIESLKARILDRTFKDINGILVVKHGEVLFEAFFDGEGPDTLHDIRSAGKSITSALVGIAIDKGFILGVDQKLLSYFSGVSRCRTGWDPRKAKITLKHLLSMSFGLAEPGEFPAWESNGWYKKRWIRDVLCQPVEFEPGSRFDYDTAAPALFGPIIEKASGMSVGRFAEDFLFGPLGIKHYKWRILPDGREHTGGGFRMGARDMARFGQLYLQKGEWNGQQLISRQWVEESTKAHLVANGQLDQSYGYYWWREAFHISDRWIETYSASGNGGNKIYVFPSEDIVVVITASAYDLNTCHTQVRMIMNKFILPAIIQNERSGSGEPVLKTIPKSGFLISLIVFLFTLLLCILWPKKLQGNPVPAKQSTPITDKENRILFYFVRTWIGINALIVIIVVGSVLKRAEILDLWLNTGYARLIVPTITEVISSWLITIFTTGSIVLLVISWKGRYWSTLASGWFSIHALVLLYCVFYFEYLGLLVFFY